MPDSLLLGPLIRYIDETSATVWVETVRPCSVVLQAGGRTWSAGTFTVHGHHYALVEVDGLEPGSVHDYTVSLDGERVWPPADSRFPPSRIATLKQHRRLRVAFGSCRTSISHDATGNRKHGVDALRAYALNMANGDADGWPDLVLFLGDQVYADLTSDEMREFIASRRSLDEPPGEELKDYQEYAHLYRLAWTDEANRWLLSTLPSAMIFDDHDIRDDWNTSLAWRREIETLPWWHDRIVAGLGSYWVYQHLGNLSPEARASDELWQQIKPAADRGEQRDFGELIDAFAERVDRHPHTYRWSYARDIGGSRLIVIDSRNDRELEEHRRCILGDDAMGWLDDQMQGGFDHLLVGTSLPFLLSQGLHYFEAWNEAVADGAWGRRFRPRAEKLRRAIDLEHWAAFQQGFQKVAQMVLEVADGRRGDVPSTITFLSGDVHNSYVAEVDREGPCRVLQAVCSPIRNPLPWVMRRISGFSSKNLGAGVGAWLARRARVKPAPFSWRTVHGPWFDNNLATLESDGRKLWLRWEGGRTDDPPGLAAKLVRKLARRTVDRDAHEDPALVLLQEVRIDA
ncbi:MAG TPA: alkaline phosphatase D family protein [Nocardioidaceae bacterium]|nr:alkaline phosphatase D family protein [Nocardioidaceae bacterium]